MTRTSSMIVNMDSDLEDPALVSFLSNMISFWILEDGANAVAVYLDFAKAFDKVSHTLVLLKINKMGIKVIYTNSLSHFFSVDSSVLVLKVLYQNLNQSSPVYHKVVCLAL